MIIFYCNAWPSFSVLSNRNLNIRTETTAIPVQTQKRIYFENFCSGEINKKARPFYKSKKTKIGLAFEFFMSKQMSFPKLIPRGQHFRPSRQTQERNSTFRPRYIKVKVEHYILLMFSPPKVSWVTLGIKYICLHLLPVFYLIQPSSK